MERPIQLPADWGRFLDQVQADLRLLLEHAHKREDSQKEPSTSNPSPLSASMKGIHQGMDDRLGKLEQRLKELDGSLSLAETQAQRLQQSASQLRDAQSRPVSAP